MQRHEIWRFNIVVIHEKKAKTSLWSYEEGRVSGGDTHSQLREGVWWRHMQSAEGVWWRHVQSGASLLLDSRMTSVPAMKPCNDSGTILTVYNISLLWLQLDSYPMKKSVQTPAKRLIWHSAVLGNVCWVWKWARFALLSCTNQKWNFMQNIVCRFLIT